MTTEVKAAPAAMTHEEWIAEGTRRFGADQLQWKFVCPCCKVVISVQDYKDAGAPESAVAFNCVGRYGYRDCYRPFSLDYSGDVKQPCDYTGGGLFRLNPLLVTFPDDKELRVFAFAPAEVGGA